MHARGRYLGIQTEMISAAEAARRLPIVDPTHFVGALADRDHGHVDPAGVTHAYVKAAVAEGAQVRRHTWARSIVRAPSGNQSTGEELIHCIDFGGEIYVWAMDVARFGDWATRPYVARKVTENYRRRFSIRFPNEYLPEGRPLATTPIYDTLRSRGAVFGDSFGLEVPLWFAPRPGSDDPAEGMRALRTWTVEVPPGPVGVDAAGDEPIWCNGQPVGWVTSGGYAHHSDASVAMGYVPAALATKETDFEVELLGTRRRAHLVDRCLWDPDGIAMRA